MKQEWVTGALTAGALAAAVILPAALITPIPHTGGDNAGYLTLAHSLLERGAYLDLWDLREPIHTKYPPIFPLLLAIPMALGVNSWMGFKLVPLFFSVVGLLLFHGWVRRREGVVLAAAATLLLALAPDFLQGTRWLLSEPPFLAFTLLALWLARTGDPPPGEAHPAISQARGGNTEGSRVRGGGSGDTMGPVRLALLTGAVILAFFTRSAGLPLVLALLAWLVIHGRWKPLPWVGAGVLVPAFLWWLRAQRGGEPDYVAEFWMVDPYRPELGTAGAGELAGRVVANAQGYLLEYLPGGLFALPDPLLAGAGMILFVLAGLGWSLRLRQGVGLAELFLPLYAGVLLLWPEVWAGGRFALPLFPLLLYYGGVALFWVGRRLPASLALGAGVAIFLALTIPGAGAWWQEVQENRGCTEWVRVAGPLACHSSAFQEFGAAARWTGERLPSGVGVLSRNPRHFYVLSGQAGQLFPLTANADEFLAGADALGAHVLIVDRLTALTDRYVVPVVRATPTSFCFLAQVGDPQGISTQILAILPPSQRNGAETERGDGVYLERCAQDFPAGGRSRDGTEGRALPPPQSPLVPFLAPRP
ncbi:MAG: hypothetical protein WEA09_03295 [Gemmatimonadota bacterium]